MPDNAVVGYDTLERHNLLHNETNGTPRTHRLCSIVGPIWTQLNTKHDRFAQNTSLPNASDRVGGWPVMLGVGCRDIFTMFAANNAVEAQEYPGFDASIGTSHTARNDPFFVDYKAVTSGPTARASNGDYSL